METQDGVVRRLLKPRVVVALVSPLVLLANIAVITVFIVRENWQGVILSFVVFIAVTQAVFWFFRARSILNAHQQLRNGLRRTQVSQTVPDDPPPYEEVVKTEAPPPPYYMVVSETALPSTSTSHNSETNHQQTKVKTKNTKASGKPGTNIPNATRNLRGITSPFLPTMTNDEGNTITPIPTPPANAPIDPVEIIRAPITRGESRILVPTHLPSLPGNAGRESAGTQ